MFVLCDELPAPEERRSVYERFADAYSELMELFAVNSTYFPGKKRTEGDINGFAKKPKDCCVRLLRIIKLAAENNTILQAVEELKSLAADIKQLGEEKFGKEIQ